MTGRIRVASPHDADQAIPLLCEAGGGICHVLAGTDDVAEMTRILLEFFRSPANRLSYENALVLERDGAVIGVLVCYPGGQSALLDQPFSDRQLAQNGRIREPILKEPDDDEYYLDSLAVAAAYRGQGIATALMEAFETRAAENGFDKVALLAEEHNTPAYRLYRKQGYVTDKIVRLYGEEYHHMVKHGCQVNAG